MATDVIMPALGVAQEKGTLLNWRKAEGQTVTRGEPLMEVETDKATVEIEAPASGILNRASGSASRAASADRARGRLCPSTSGRGENRGSSHAGAAQ
jgi:hypothetical protein